MYRRIYRAYVDRHGTHPLSSNSPRFKILFGKLFTRKDERSVHVVPNERPLAVGVPSLSPSPDAETSEAVSLTSRPLDGTPVEILEQILDIVDDDYTQLCDDFVLSASTADYSIVNRKRIANLHSFALVCTNWNRIVTRRLYQHTHILAFRSLHLLAQSLASKPELRSLIRELTFNPNAQGMLSSLHFIYLEVNQLVSSVCGVLLPEVNVNVSVILDPTFDQSTPNSLFDGQDVISRLSILQLNCVNCQTLSAFKENLTLPRLRTPVIKNTVIDATNIHWPSMPVLEELCLDNTHVDSNVDVFTEFKSLKRLEMRLPNTGLGFVTAQYFFTSFGGNLEELKLMANFVGSIVPWAIHHAIHDLAHLKNLRSFSVGRAARFGRIHDDLVRFDFIGPTLISGNNLFSPRTPGIPLHETTQDTRHLTTILDMCKNMISSLKGNLRSIRFFGDQSLLEVTAEDIDALKSVCEGYGVEFALFPWPTRRFYD